MDSRESQIWRAPPPPPFLTSEEIVLPMELILNMGNFMKFEDYRNFIRSLWPNNDEGELVRTKLWQMSTYRFTTKFLNGKLLEVEYNFDPSRKTEDRILINVEYLLPLFGGLVPPAMNKFSTLTELLYFVRIHIHLNMCSNYRRAYCPCHLRNNERHSAGAFTKPAVNVCRHGHFHHYCSQHVIHWMIFSLGTLIWDRHVGGFCNEDVIEEFLYFLDNIVSFRGLDVHLWGSLMYRVI